MQVTYADGDYTKQGSVLREVRRLIRIRSVRGALTLGRTHIPAIRQTIRHIRTTDDDVEFESELLYRIQEFFKGDYEGEVAIEFELVIQNDAVVGAADAEFSPVDDDFTVSVTTEKETEHEIQVLVADVLRLFLQYNVEIPELSCESVVDERGYVLRGHGQIWIPTTLEQSTENLPLVADFPFSNVPFRRLLGL